MKKFAVGSQWRNKAGMKSTITGISDDGLLSVTHESKDSYYRMIHKQDGTPCADEVSRFNLIEPWVEPEQREFLKLYREDVLAKGNALAQRHIEAAGQTILDSMRKTDKQKPEQSKLRRLLDDTLLTSDNRHFLLSAIITEIEALQKSDRFLAGDCLWLNVYKNGAGFGHKTRADADKEANSHRIARIKVPYRKGQFDE